MRRFYSTAVVLGLAAVAAGGAGAVSSAEGAVLPDVVPEPISRYAFDTTTVKGRVLLRLDGGLTNRGQGDVAIVASRLNAGVSTMTGAQRIANGDGTFFDGPANAFTLQFHRAADHGHWHARDLFEFRLRRVVGTDSRTGKIPWCLRDLKNRQGLVPLNTPAVYLECGTAVSTNVLMGLQPGFTDIYEAELPDQWIDITGVRPGRYTLGATVDPQNLIAESNDANNSNSIPFKLPAITDTLRRQRSNVKEVQVRPRGRNAIIAYATLSHPSVVRAEIFLVRGTRVTLVQTLQPRRYRAGRIVIPWNGRTSTRRLAPAGRYSVKLTATASRIKSDPKYFKFRVLPKVRR